MNKPLNGFDINQAPSLLDQLLLLARVLRVDPDTGDLCLQNGAACIVLKSDGTVRITGARVVTVADESVVIDAASIHLN
jgi:hypothetical protein